MTLLDHSALQKLAIGTRGTAWEGQVWLVGGCVRDSLLGISETTDFDLVSEMDVLPLVEWLWQNGLSQIAPVTYPRYGTALTRLDGQALEWVTARRESYEIDSRKPETEPSTLLDDARRRDFTVNSLMLNLHSGETLDLLGTGLADLRDGVLRTPQSPETIFAEDPLRIVRAVRFKAQLGFEFAPGLEEGLIATLPRLSVISVERFRDEFIKMLRLGPRATDGLREFLRLGILERLLPEFAAMVGVEQGKFHHLDVWDHTMLVLENANTRDPILALACLFHDIAKPVTRMMDESGQTRFFGHESVGAKMTADILRRLKFSNEEADAVVLLVKNHMRLGTMDHFTSTAARRLVRDLRDHLPRLLDLVEADAASLRPGVRVMDLDQVRERLEEVARHTPAETLKSPLSGKQVMEVLQLEPGPEVGRVQKWLAEQVLEGNLEPEDETGALALLKSHYTAAATEIPADQ